jgi:hypothetical protein
MPFDRDEMMTQTKHDLRRRDLGGAIGIVTVQDWHPHRRGQDVGESRVHLHATVYARLSGTEQVSCYIDLACDAHCVDVK